MLHAYCIGRDCLGIGEHTRSGCFYRISGLGILGINFLFLLLYGGSAVSPAAALLGRQRRLLGMRGTLRHQLLTWCRRWSTTWSSEGSRRRAACRCSALLCVAGSARLTPTCRRPSSATSAALANIYGLSECGFAFLFGKRRGDAF